MKGIITYCGTDRTECAACQANMKTDLTDLESIEGWLGKVWARNSKPKSE